MVAVSFQVIVAFSLLPFSIPFLHVWVAIGIGCLLPGIHVINGSVSGLSRPIKTGPASSFSELGRLLPKSEPLASPLCSILIPCDE